MHYVLSDIHGNRAAFDALLTMIELQLDDHLYILGDVIDRGPDGITLLQRIRAMKNTTLLLGNHEYMMIKALRCPWDYYAMRVWQKNGNRWTLEQFNALSSEAQEDMLKYLESLPIELSVQIGSRERFLLVHATPTELYDDTYWRYDNEREFAVWYRMPLTKPQNIAGTIIIGHTPTIRYDDKAAKMHIVRGDGVIDIDCGCAYPQYGGQLGCLRLEDMKEYYSSDALATIMLN